MIDPKSVARDRSAEATSSPVPHGPKAHPWAWLVGIVVAALLVWGFFGMDHLKPAINPAMAPVTSTSAAG